MSGATEDRYSGQCSGLGTDVQLVRADTRPGHGRGVRRWAVLCWLLAAVGWLGACATAGASVIASASPTAGASTISKRVTYRGYTIRVPADWPVYRLAGNSTVCVRFNRHAVYLGRPSTHQRCPATALGRTEAILVAPLGASRNALPSGGSVAERTIRSRRLTVTATWNHDPAVVERALGGRLTPPPAPAPVVMKAARLPLARAASRPHQAGEVYAGLGFDACAAPSLSTMTAWGASPYRALGVYVGGANMACSQPNLTPTWVADEWAAGWHLIPTYVGLQAPTNSCGCQAMSTNTTTAGAQGAAAAEDAVVHAQAIGIGAGNPIYDDMESYGRTSTNTSAVLAFLSAWTAQLHAEGYLSGVYSSADAGITDLANQFGTTYLEPDDIWIADWNGAQTTSDASVPSADWAANQRLHQYRGGHNETYDGVTLNIDNNYLDGATAFGASVALPPSLRVTPISSGAVQVSASWQGGIGLSSWLILGGRQPTSLGYVSENRPAGAVTTVAEGSSYPYYEAEALGSAGQVLASTPVVATTPHVAVYGRSVFVPSQGLVGVPSGCFTGTTCRVALGIYAGGRRIAHSGREFLGNSGSLLFITLSPADRRMLADARGRRLPVTVQASDVSGASAVTSMNLVPFQTTGAGPHRSLKPASTLRVIGTSDFVYRGFSGGILAGCSGSSPCLIKTTITAGRTTVATTGKEFIGANEAGYLNFSLTPAGRQLLARAPGNQLGVRVTLNDGTATARATIALSSFS